MAVDYNGNSTIQSAIDNGKQLRINNPSLHYKSVVTNSKAEKLVVNMNSIFERYYDILLEHTVIVTLDDEEQMKYNYKPKVLSYDLYGTYELDFLLLQLNHMTSVIEFRKSEYTVFSSNIVELLNEIIILEQENTIQNDLDIINKLNE